jgi:hypothetical protein
LIGPELVSSGALGASAFADADAEADSAGFAPSVGFASSLSQPTNATWQQQAASTVTHLCMSFLLETHR